MLTKVCLVKAMVFSSSQVWMWELDYKESWTPKSWCFWTVVLEKTLESPLDCKEIKPVHPKGNQSWIFIGRTDVNAETPILWPPDVKNWLIWRLWCWERLKAGGKGDDRGWDGWVVSPTQWSWVWVSSRSWWWAGRPGVLQSMGSRRVGHDWVTEVNWIESNRFDRGVCNFLSSVLPQQKFEAVDQCYSSVTVQFYLASKGKYIIELWGWADPKDAKRRGSILALLFTCFSPSLSLLCVNWASQEGCLFCLRSSLWSLDLPFFYFQGLFPLATAMSDSFFLYQLPNRLKVNNLLWSNYFCFFVFRVFYFIEVYWLTLLYLISAVQQSD